MATESPRRYSLDVIPIQSPCTEDWNRMRGGEAVKFCDKCQLQVHNLSAMPAEAADRLLAQREGRLCVRYEVEPPPAPAASPTRDTIELRRKRNRPAAWWRRAAAMIGLGFLGGAGLTLGGCGEQEEVMGDVVAPVTLDPSQSRPPELQFGGAGTPETGNRAVVGLVAYPTTRPAIKEPRTVKGEVALSKMGDTAAPPRPVMGSPAVPATQPAVQPAACENSGPLQLTKPAPRPPTAIMGRQGPRPNIVMGEIEATPAPIPPPATQPAN